MSSLIALKPRAVALLRAAILFAAKDDVCERLTAVCIDPDPAAPACVFRCWTSA